MLKVSKLPESGPWPTSDPFLFCVHHKDIYPKANNNMGPDAKLDQRNIGSDFSNIDGWSMYHGDKIPGFPKASSYRGFETITIVDKGLIDHSDSLGFLLDMVMAMFNGSLLEMEYSILKCFLCLTNKTLTQ